MYLIMLSGHVVRSWRKRFFVLNAWALAYFKDEKVQKYGDPPLGVIFQALEALDSPKGIISVAGATVRPAPEKSALCIIIKLISTTVYYVEAADQESYDKWLSVSHFLYTPQ